MSGREGWESEMTTVGKWERLGSTEQEIKYLDLDGDGLPDAVLTIETLGVDVDGVHRSIEHIETLEMQIDIDGTPHDVRVIASTA
jgi:hypothetical protein